MTWLYTWAAGKAGWLVIVGALLAVVLFQHVSVSNARAGADRARTELATTKAKYALDAQKAEAAARTEETRREAAKQEVIDHARKETELAQAAARDAGAAADGLRKRLAAYVAAVRGATADTAAGKGSPSKPGADPLDVLGAVLGRADDAAGELAAYADRLRIAGQACEHAYDGLRPAGGR